MKACHVLSVAVVFPLATLMTSASALEPVLSLPRSVRLEGGPMAPGTPNGIPHGANTCPADNIGVITGGSTIVGSTIGSTDDFLTGCGTNAGGQDEIFEFTFDGRGVWGFDSCTVAACWDTTLELREETGGGCPGDFVACDGDGCNVCYYESAVSAFLVPTSTYYLIVDGWSTFAYGDFEVTATLIQPGCTVDADCDDGVFCNGAEVCDVATGQCGDGTAPCTTYEGYNAPCDEASASCPAPDSCFTWIADTIGSGYFFPDANHCPDLASWVFDDIQGSHHTTGVLDFYTTPIVARSTPTGASPLGTTFLVNQSLFDVMPGTCNPSARIAGSQCTGAATVDPGGSPPHLLPCSGSNPVLPNHSGDFNVCEIDFFMAYRTTENGAGMGIAGNKPELGGPAAADDFGVSVIWLEDCPATGAYSPTLFGDDENLPADFEDAVVCQKPCGKCCAPDGLCSQKSEAECAAIGGTHSGTGTIFFEPGTCEVCEGDADGNGIDDGCEACGDTICGGSENQCNCPADCPVTCGDGCCSSTPRAEDCPRDCDCDIAMGSDRFETQCGTSIIDLRNIPIPGETFGPNAKAFDGVLWLFSSSARDFGLRWTRSELADACGATPSPLLVEEIYLATCNPIPVERDDASGNFDFWDVEVTLSPVAAPIGEMAIQRTHANGGTFTAEIWVRPSFKLQPTVQSDPPVSVEFPSGGQVLPPFRLRTVGAASFVDTPDPVLTINAGSVGFVPGVREDLSTGDQCCERFQLSGPDVYLELFPPKCAAFCPRGACCLPNEFEPANRCDDALDETGCQMAGGIWQSAWAGCDDQDGDGLQDGFETRAARGLLDACHHGTDPLNPDTDGDTCSDFMEVVQSFDVRTDALRLCESFCGAIPIVSDCNNNDRDDRCDIECGAGNICDGVAGSDDCNGNGIPDKCEAGACCGTSVTGVAACVERTEQTCLSLTPPGTFLGPCVACPEQAAGTALHDGVLIIHTVGGPVDCPDGSGARSTGTCTPGAPLIDPWKSVENDPGNPGLCHNFGVSNGPCGPIPAGFFGPGSDVFNSPLCLEGVSLGSQFGEADTLVSRLTDPFDRCDIVAFPTTAAPVEVKIVELSLASIDPITVTFNGGSSPEEWDVTVELSPGDQPVGMLTATKEHCNGGTYFTNGFSATPLFRFTKVSDPGVVRVLDTRQAGCAAVLLDINPASPAPWVHDVDPNSGIVIDECSDFHPGIEDAAPTTACNCNTNSVRDVCEVEQGSSQDCNGDGIPDECQLAGNDCNGNGIPDECEIDCNTNGVPDDCDIDPADPDGNGLVSSDCDGGNGNGVPDECEFDCNNNFSADSCDIARGTSNDVDANAVPDECLGELTGRCCLSGGECIRVTQEVCNASDGAFGGIGSLCGDDVDGDGATDDCDNCPIVGNPDQQDCDGDGEGDACETDPAVVDDDGDGHCNGFDNCPAVLNPGQDDCNGDGEGDACEVDAADRDDDHDGVCASFDNCPAVLNRGQEDCNGDGVGDACEVDAANEDDDQDGICNDADNCPDVANSGQEDCGGDGVGDVCEAQVANRDGDNDGVCNGLDNCPGIANPMQEDCDGDGEGDACDVGSECDGACCDGAAGTCIDQVGLVDCELPSEFHEGLNCADLPDSDGDGVPDCSDKCPVDPNKVEPGICGCGVSDELDSDGDGVPDCSDQCPGVDDAVFAPECKGKIPTVSVWGLVILALLLLAAGKVYFSRRRFETM